MINPLYAHMQKNNMAHKTAAPGAIPENGADFAHMVEMASQINIREIKKAEENHFKKIETRNTGKSNSKSATLSLFCRSSGPVTFKKETPAQKAEKEFVFDDKIRLSLEARQEMQEDKEGKYGIFGSKNPINMFSFCDNLDITPPNKRGL